MLYRVCLRFRLTNKDDYFRVTFDHFEASNFFETQIGWSLKPHHHNQKYYNVKKSKTKEEKKKESEWERERWVEEGREGGRLQKCIKTILKHVVLFWAFFFFDEKRGNKLQREITHGATNGPIGMTKHLKNFLGRKKRTFSDKIM